MFGFLTKGKVKKLRKNLQENQGKTPPPGTVHTSKTKKKNKKGQF